jgi:hypothetical protein
MSITSVNPYVSAYQTAATNNKQTNNLLDTVENTQSKVTTRPGEDTVSISEEASQKSRAEQYALKTDPVAFYQEWLESDPRYLTLAGPKPYEELLPETQAYIDQLHERLQQATTGEDRLRIQGLIGTASSYGDKEIIDNDGDVILRRKVETVALSLKLAHLEIHNEPFPRPEGHEIPSGIDRFSDLNGFRETVIAANEKIGISREQTLAAFAEIEERNRQVVKDFYYGWLNGSRTIENDPFFTEDQSFEARQKRWYAEAYDIKAYQTKG